MNRSRYWGREIKKRVAIATLIICVLMVSLFSYLYIDSKNSNKIVCKKISQDIIDTSGKDAKAAVDKYKNGNYGCNDSSGYAKESLQKKQEYFSATYDIALYSKSLGDSETAIRAAKDAKAAYSSISAEDREVMNMGSKILDLTVIDQSDEK